MRVTRTISAFGIKAVKADYTTMTFSVIGETTCVATHMTKTLARKALIAAGVNVPRGCEVTFEKLSDTLYACDLEDFMKIASPITVEDVDDEDID